MNLKPKITLVIPTFNRYDRLYRLLKYYESFNFPFYIIVLDSSINKNKPQELVELLNSGFIKYFEYSKEIGFACKLLNGLEVINSPYTVLCADDDFLTPNGISACVSFLDQNQDYLCAQGRSIMFMKSVSTNNITWQWADIEAKSIEENCPESRFFNHFTKYTAPTIYAVTRTSTLLDALRETAKFTNDNRFGELLPTLLTVIFGKMKILEVTYSFREYNTTSDSHTVKTIPDFIRDGEFETKYFNFTTCLTKALISVETFSEKQAKKLIDEAMGKYLGSTLLRILTKYRIKKIFGDSDILKIFISIFHKFKSQKKQWQQMSSLRPIEWANLETQCSKDIFRIKETLEKHTAR